MSDKQYIPTKAEFLADLVSGTASYSATMGSVQRSHRFPLHIITQIENLARMGDVPISLIINQLLECGLDAVLHQLSDDVASQVRMISPEQLDRKMVGDQVEVKAKATRKTKATPTK